MLVFKKEGKGKKEKEKEKEKEKVREINCTFFLSLNGCRGRNPQHLKLHLKLELTVRAKEEKKQQE